MAQPPAEVRLGIIGCGKGAELRHLPALMHTTAIRVVAAADTDLGRLQLLGDRFGIAQRHRDYRELLDRDDVSAVAILTPTKWHAEMGIASLAKGKHVLIDKPLALDGEECARLKEKASHSSGLVLVGFNFRWHRLLRRARAVVKSGALGEIKAIRSVYTHWHPGEEAQVWHARRAEGGGVIFNDGVHHFDMWRFLLEQEIAEIYAASRSSAYFEDETSTISARTADGILATGVFSFGSSPNSEIEIFGDAGRLAISFYRFDGLEFYPRTVCPGDGMDRIRKWVKTIRELPETLPRMRRGGDFTLTYDGMWQHFADCILSNRTPECTLEDGTRAVEIALAAIASIKAGTPVRLSGPE